MARLVLTRPDQHHLNWSEALRAAGHSVVCRPLIDIAILDEPEDVQRVEQAWQFALSHEAWMLVSRSAVDGFFSGRLVSSHNASPQPLLGHVLHAAQGGLRWWATGPGTAARLKDFGCPPDRIDMPPADSAQFDSQALWDVVRKQVGPGSKVLVVKGRDAGGLPSTRDWLGEQIRDRGGEVTSLVVYERRQPRWTAQSLEQCQTWLSDASIWIISSSVALKHLPGSLNMHRSRCVCTHERIAQAAQQRGFMQVQLARPTLPDVLASIKLLDD